MKGKIEYYINLLVSLYNLWKIKFNKTRICLKYHQNDKKKIGTYSFTIKNTRTKGNKN